MLGSYIFTTTLQGNAPKTGAAAPSDVLHADATWAPAGGGGTITGSGTTGKHAKFSGATAIGDSLLADNGNDVAVGTAGTQTNFLAQNGASKDDNGNNVEIRGGDAATGVGAGGFVSLIGGFAPGGDGGGTLLRGGTEGGDFATGGLVQANGATAGGNGGGVQVLASNGAGTGDGGDVTIDAGAGSGGGANGNIILATLPSADPGVPGALYRTAGAVMVSL